MLEQQLEDVEQTLKDMRDRYEKKCREQDDVEKHLKEKTKQLMYEEHQAKLEINELENTLTLLGDDRTAQNGLMLNDVKIKDLTEMLQNASSPEQNRQGLQRRISEITNANKLIEDEIKQERQRCGDSSAILLKRRSDSVRPRAAGRAGENGGGSE